MHCVVFPVFLIQLLVTIEIKCGGVVVFIYYFFVTKYLFLNNFMGGYESQIGGHVYTYFSEQMKQRCINNLVDNNFMSN